MRGTQCRYHDNGRGDKALDVFNAWRMVDPSLLAVNFEESSLLFIEALADLTANGHYPRSDDVTGQNTFRQRKEQVVRLDHNSLGPAKAVSTYYP